MKLTSKPATDNNIACPNGNTAGGNQWTSTDLDLLDDRAIEIESFLQVNLQVTAWL